MVEFIKKYRINIFLVVLAIVVIISNLFFVRFTIDLILLTLIVIAFVFKKQKEFIKDWFFPIVLFYVYEFLRGRAYKIAVLLDRPIYVQPLIDIEKALFNIGGVIPTVWLQNNFVFPSITPFIPSWYDYVVFFFYAQFFWFWLVCAFVIWYKSRNLFKKFIYGLMGFSIFDTIIYILFPTAPPWYASKIELLPDLIRSVLSYDYFSARLVTFISTYGRNDFAALPSHHASWPFFSALFIILIFGRKSLPILILPFLIAFATWYGAEHYIIDSLLGYIIALITFFIVTNPRVEKKTIEIKEKIFSFIKSKLKFNERKVEV